MTKLIFKTFAINKEVFVMRRKLNKEKLQSRKRSTMPMKESLRDIEPIPWHDDVSHGDTKVSMRKAK